MMTDGLPEIFTPGGEAATQPPRGPSYAIGNPAHPGGYVAGPYGTVGLALEHFGDTDQCLFELRPGIADVIMYRWDDPVWRREPGETTRRCEEVDDELTPEGRDWYVEAAQNSDLLSDGVLEVDDNAKVSVSEDGAYVGAWLWVGGRPPA
jgi:hypothetical protein